MNPKGLVVVLFLVAITGAGVWLGLRSGGDREPQPIAPAAVHATAGGGLDALTADQAGASVAAADAPGKVERTALATGKAADDDRTFALRGRLVDKAQAPKAGVTVLLTAFATPFDFEPPALPLPRRGADRSADRGEQRPHTESGQDGRFEFRVKSGQSGFVTLDGKALVLRQGEARFSALKTDFDLGDLQVIAASVLAGVVQDAHRQPVADVKVGSTRGGELAFGFEQSATTDAQGRFRLDGLLPGNVTLRTASAKFLPTLRELELAAEQQQLDVVLAVVQGNAISGQVVDDRGQPVAGIKVGAKRKEQKAGVSMERFTPDEATVSDAGGWFTLSGLQGDTASVRAWGAGHAPVAESNVPVGTGNLLLRVQRCGAIAGVLKDSAGAPIAGSRVSAAARGNGDGMLRLGVEDLDLPLPAGDAVATTGDDGSFHIDGVAPGTVTVRARGKGHRPAEHAGVAVHAAQTTEGIALVAERGATARVKVLDDAGAPVVKATVRASQKKAPPAGDGGGFRSRQMRVESSDSGHAMVFGGDQNLGQAETDSAGIAELDGLPAGPATFTAAHDGLAEPKPIDLTMPTTGVVDASMVMRRPGWAQLRVVDAAGRPEGTRWVVHGPIGSDEDERDRSGATDQSGATRVGPLPPGQYFAELELAGASRPLGGASFMVAGDSRRLPQTHSPFTIIGGKDTEVTLTRPVLTRLYGKVTDGDGPVAGCVVELQPAAAAAGEPGPLADFGQHSAHTGTGGEYEIADVAAGQYSIRWGKPEQLVKARQALEVPADLDQLHQDLQLRVGKLKVQAFSKTDGEGIEGAEVELIEGASAGDQPAPQRRRVMMVSMSLSSDGGGDVTTMSMGDQHKKTDADGNAVLDDVPPGTYTVRITHDKHVTKELKNQSVAEGQTTDCGRADMEQAGRIRGRVLAADGKPAGMALVQCRKVGESGDGQRQPAIGGAFTFNGLAPGSYTLRAQAIAMNQDSPPFGPEVEVEVKAGRTPTAAELQVAR
ncbi:MAG TPA: carboxypeptidase-like regulatory domain-containing protein [Planctomycetota bacterium]|nr:carboxypeptidase-like regulatory domain-containing protein [Planctomycetota bacterium]